jgi:CRP/FNR family transcriptional regulator
MVSSRTRNILERFPFYEQADQRLREELEASATFVQLPAGEHVFREGDVCGSVVFLGRGAVRVFKAGETGREITLYHLEPGEACILNVACVVANVPYPAQAVTDVAVEAVVVDPGLFLGWMEKAAPVRSFVFRMMSQRFVSLLVRVEDLILSRLDRRLARFLLSASRSPDGIVHLTHEAVAAELGSAREVMSRLLKDLERRGAVHLQRGQIGILDEDQLERIAAETAGEPGTGRA